MYTYVNSPIVTLYATNNACVQKVFYVLLKFKQHIYFPESSVQVILQVISCLTITLLPYSLRSNIIALAMLALIEVTIKQLV